MDDLLANYCKYTRPTLSSQTPTIVTLEFGLRKIGSLVSRARDLEITSLREELGHLLDI